MSNLSSAASEEKPDFPRFASEDDTEICDLLLTVDNVSIYSDDCKERAFVPTAASSDPGDLIAHGKLHVVQYTMPPDKGVVGSPQQPLYGAFINCEAVNIPVVSAKTLSNRVYSLTIGGSVFRIYLSESTPADLVQLFETIMMHFSTDNNADVSTAATKVDSKAAPLGELSEKAQEAMGLSTSPPKTESDATLPPKPPASSATSQKWGAGLMYKASETMTATSQYAKSTIDYYGGASADSIKTYASVKKESVEPRGDIKIGFIPRATLGVTKFTTGTGVRITRGVVWGMSSVAKGAAKGIAGSRLGAWLETGGEGGLRHALKTLIESGILSYGEIYTALGNHGQAMLAASCEGFTDVTTKMYGAEAARTAGTLGSISKDLGEMAWSINSIGVKTTVTAFGKGLVKGAM